MTPVTDPAILSQLDGGTSAQPKPVSDPALLAQLNGPANQDPAFMASRTKQMRGATGGDSTAGFVGGNANIGLANMGGMPVDFIHNLMNLGIAGVGMGRESAGPARAAAGQKPLAPPDLLPPPVGGSQWIQGKMGDAGLIPPSATPQSPGGEYAAKAIQMGVGGAIPMSRAASIPQVLKQIPAAATSGVTAQAAKDIGGPEWEGVGAMAPGARGIMKPPTAGETATAGRQAERFQTAKGMGIPIPPREMKADPRQQSQQDAINQELRQPPGTEISPKTLQAYRNAHADNYNAVTKDPALKNGVVFNKKFQTDIQQIGDELSKPGKDLPETFKGTKGVIKLLGEYGYAGGLPPNMAGQVPPRKPMPADVAMRAIRKLRDDASTNFRGEKPEQLELARVQVKLSQAIEDAIESNLKNPDTIKNFRESRVAMAKSHAIEDSLDPKTRQFDAGRLSKLYTEGSPLTGNLKGLAEVSGEFPGAMSVPKDTDMFSKRMSPFGVTHPGAVVAHGAAKLMDPITTSRPYQEMFVNPANKASPEQLRMLRYLLGAEGATQSGQIPAPPDSRGGSGSGGGGGGWEERGGLDTRVTSGSGGIPAPPQSNPNVTAGRAAQTDKQRAELIKMLLARGIPAAQAQAMAQEKR